MLRMALRRSIPNPFIRADVSEPAEEAGREGGTETVNGVVVEQLGARGPAGAEGIPSTYRRSTTSVFSSLSGRSRLPSRVFTSPPKKLFGHLAVCGDRFRHRAGARTKNEESNEEDGVTVLERKALTGTVTTIAPEIAAPSSAPPWHSKPEDTSLPFSNQQKYFEERQQQQQQQHLVNKHQQLAPQCGHQQQKQGATEWETRRKKLQTQKSDEEQEQSKLSVIDKQYISSKGTHQPETQRSVFAEKTDALQAPAVSCDFAHLRKPEHTLEHRYSTSTASASRRSSNGSENVPTNLGSVSHRQGAGGADGVFSALIGSGTSSCGVYSRRCGSRLEHGWGCDSTRSDTGDRRNTFKAKYIGVDVDRGENSISGTEEGRIKTAGGTSHPRGRVHDASTFAGRHRDSPAGTTAETSSLHVHHLSHKMSASLLPRGDTTPPLLMLPSLADPTSAPKYPGASESPYASGIPCGSHSAVSSAASSAVSSPARSTAASPASSPPANSSAASADAAAATGRFKRTVGMRLSEMLLQGRTVLRLGSGEKDAITTPNRLARSRTVPNLSPSAHPASAVSAKSSYPPKSGGDAPSSETSRLSLFPRSSPLLLRQLRRRTPGRHRRAGPDGTDTAAGAAADTAEIRGDQGYYQHDLHQKAVSVVSAGEVISETAADRTRETTRRAGVLRRGREGKSATRGGGGKDEEALTRGRGTVVRRAAREGRAARRVTSSGVSDTSGEGRGQVKCVRFGSMSVHVYTREARIRSCSSDSVNFAVTLDPPVSTDAYWHCARDRTKRAFQHATDDFDDAEPDFVEEADSGNKDEPEEEEEEIQGYQGCKGRIYRPAGGRHNYSVLSRNDVCGSAEHAATGAADRKHGLAVEERIPVPCTGDTLHCDPRWHVRGERGERHLTGHIGKADRSDDTIDLAGQPYPSAYLFRKPQDSHTACDSYEEPSSHIDMCLALKQAQQNASAACGHSTFSPMSTLDISHGHTYDECLHERRIAERQKQPREGTAVADAHGSAQSTAADCAPKLESCKASEGDMQFGEFSQNNPVATDHERETLAASHSISTRKVEPNTADWWRRLLSNWTSEAENHSADIHRLVTHVEQRDKSAENECSVSAGNKDDAPESGRFTAQTPPVAASLTVGRSTADSLPAANEIVCRESVASLHSSLPDSQGQRLKSNEPMERGLEQHASGQRQKVTGEGSGSNGRHPRASKASSLEDVRLPELKMQSRAKSSDPMGKGMKSTAGRGRFIADPRRVHSDEYSGRASPYTQWQRVLSDTLIRKELKGELQESQFELKYVPMSSKKEVPISDHTQKQHVSGTDDSSPFPHVHGAQKLQAEKDSQVSTRVEQPCLQREKNSVCSPKSEEPALEWLGSSTCFSCSSTIASSGIHSKDSNASTFQDMSSRYISSDLFSEHDLHSRTGSHSTIVPCDCSSLSSFPCVHSTAAIGQLHIPADGTAKHHDAPQGHQQQLLLHHQSNKLDGPVPQQELASRGSVTGGSRSSLDEEMLNKATEEVIARSASHMTAEEKENLRDILKGWCS